MLEGIVLVIHIAVLGYWLGAELVINSTYRYVAFSAAMPFDERSRLMEHVMDVDQHVRYALVIQASLGTILAARYGYVPGGHLTTMAAGVLGLAWLCYIEVVHRLRNRPVGKRLAAMDRNMRYPLMIILVLIGLGLMGAEWAMPGWLRLKLALFAGVMACGVGIRIALMKHFQTWARMTQEGVSDIANADIRQIYFRATGILLLLWVFIGGMVLVSVWKPI